MECWQRRQRQQRRRRQRRRRRHAGLIRRRRRRNPSAKNAAKTRPRTQGALLPQEGEENFVYRSRILWHIRGKRKVLWPSIRPLTHPAAHRSPLRNLARLLHGEREREREHEWEWECEIAWESVRECDGSRREVVLRRAECKFGGGRGWHPPVPPTQPAFARVFLPTLTHPPANPASWQGRGTNPAVPVILLSLSENQVKCCVCFLNTETLLHLLM